MSFLARLFGNVFSLGPDPREEWRPLWQRTVAEARDPDWYRMCGVADSIEGRYDMITLVLTLVMLRLEDEGGDPNTRRRGKPSRRRTGSPLARTNISR